MIYKIKMFSKTQKRTLFLQKNKKQKKSVKYKKEGLPKIKKNKWKYRRKSNKLESKNLKFNRTQNHTIEEDIT